MSERRFGGLDAPGFYEVVLLPALSLESGKIDALELRMLARDGLERSPQFALALDPDREGLEQLEAGQIALAASADLEPPRVLGQPGAGLLDRAFGVAEPPYDAPQLVLSRPDAREEVGQLRAERGPGMVVDRALQHLNGAHRAGQMVVQVGLQGLVRHSRSLLCYQRASRSRTSRAVAVSSRMISAVACSRTASRSP